jgi:hypothetical protein
MRKSSYLILNPTSLIVVILLILGSYSVSFATEVDIFQGRIDRLIYGDVYTTFGKSESEIVARIGPSMNTETRTLPNLPMKGAPHTHAKLLYKGLSIDLLRSGAPRKDLLVRIVLEDPGYTFSGGLAIGSKRKDLEAHLGPPWKTDESGNLVYGDAERNSKVIFKLVKDEVKSITWNYYFD